MGPHMEGMAYAKENWIVSKRAATKAIFDCCETIFAPVEQNKNEGKKFTPVNEVILTRVGSEFIAKLGPV